MNTDYKRIYAQIDLDAVENNMKSMLKNLPQDTKMIGVLKTDGYGHGAVPVAETIDRFVCGYALAAPEEALNLRINGITKPLFLLGPVHKSWYEKLIGHKICPVIFTYEDAEELNDTAQRMNARAVCHLAVDTGMHRIGMIPSEESGDMVGKINALENLEIMGMFTHFARADETDKTKAEKQYRMFSDFSNILKKRGIFIPLTHCANSAAIIDIPEFSMDAVRAGISIYGLYPSDEVGHGAVPLEPAMSLHSFITCIRNLKPGDEVSYGGTFSADRPMRIATVSAGYGDGYPRNLSGKGKVLIAGKYAPVLGRICMDQFMVDVTDIPEAAPWSSVTLIGTDHTESISVEDIAAWSGGFHYEIICNIGKRVPRVYTKSNKIIGKKDYYTDMYTDFIH